MCFPISPAGLVANTSYMTLTIGSGITVHGSQGGGLFSYYGNEQVLNQGTISADTAGGAITLNGANWTNLALASANRRADGSPSTPTLCASGFKPFWSSCWRLRC